jgi:23S rRNA (guanosine2251-2'-O)-methyltransferase
LEIPRFYQCCNPQCRLRFPAQLGRKSVIVCPKCRSPVESVPTIQDVHAANPRQNVHGLPIIHGVLDNIRSTFNVGAMFRTADGAGLQQLHLCGITPLPDQPKVAKTSLGAEHAVEWSYHPNGVEAVQKLKSSGMNILALEIGSNSQSIFDVTNTPLLEPTALVIGNEVTGIDPGILELCDQIVWIPMLGFKKSLNAAIAFAVAVYTLRFGLSSISNHIDLGNQSG